MRTLPHASNETHDPPYSLRLAELQASSVIRSKFLFGESLDI
jgi:hypothetical protein